MAGAGLLRRGADRADPARGCRRPPGPGGAGLVHLAGGTGAEPRRRDRGAAALDHRPLSSEAVGQHGGKSIMARIVDLTTASAAYGPRLLAEAGHDVVRVEAPAGDALRRLGPFL